MLIVSFILIQIILFGGLIFLLRKILNQNVVSATKHIEDLNQDYANKEMEINRQLEEAKQKSEEMLRTAQEEAQRTKTQIIQDAEAERDRILQQTHIQNEELMQHADKSRQVLLAEVNERIAKEAVDKACELIQDALPEQFKLNVHEHWVEELLKCGFVQFERLKVPQGLQEVKITSAFPLADGQRKNLVKKLKDALHRDIVLKEEVNPKMVAGFIVTIGSLVLNGSLQNKIQERARNV
ncbi:MAG: F0F1 ATP synthase subunit delta [Candidatus Omnitrophica bacterium]|nr:F0F1 ATP synthase subunit delta [Candidatus Omnitrophota bacterium]